MTTELATIDGEVVEDHQPITLFGTTDPQAVVERASVVATALAGVINERRLFSSISGKKHVQVEGWTLLGSMLGVFAEVEWSRPLDNGWEARAVARTLAGRVVGAAEAMCTTNEGRWRSADPYAVRSMAQTRAVSKALRLPLGFIMQLAGYSATPAEELNDEPGQGVRPSRRAASSETSTESAPAPATALREELATLAAERHIGIDGIEQYATLLGFPKGKRLDDAQMRQLIEAVRGHGTDAPLEVTQAAAVSEPPSEGQPAAPAPESPVEEAPGIPPRPQTDEYRALDARQKAAARSFWAEADKEARQPEPINPEQEPLGLAS